MTTADDYAQAIALLEPFVPLRSPAGISHDDARRIAMEWLLAERGLSAESSPAHADPHVIIRNTERVPRCMRCGGDVFPNVRGGRWFIDRPYHSQRDRWRQWINERAGGRLLLIDIGSGFNTPGVVRWPLEQMALELPAARLVRINLHDARVPQELKDRALSVTACARELLDAVAACYSSVAERG